MMTTENQELITLEDGDELRGRPQFGLMLKFLMFGLLSSHQVA